MMIETLIRINISPRGHNTTISPIYCFLSNCLYYCIPHITRQRERGRNPSDRTRSDSHLLHLNCRVCPLELSLSLHSTVNQDITPSEGNALTVRKSHLWLSPKCYSTISFTQYEVIRKTWTTVSTVVSFCFPTPFLPLAISKLLSLRPLIYAI